MRAVTVMWSCQWHVMSTKVDLSSITARRTRSPSALSVRCSEIIRVIRSLVVRKRSAGYFTTLHCVVFRVGFLPCQKVFLPWQKYFCQDSRKDGNNNWQKLPKNLVHLVLLWSNYNHSLTHWTAWPATGRCALQTSRLLAVSQAASAASPTSTSRWGDPCMSGTTSWTFPLRSDIRSVTGTGVDSQTKCFVRWYCSLQTTYMTEYRDSPVSDSATDALLLSLAHYWRIWHKVEPAYSKNPS